MKLRGEHFTGPLFMFATMAIGVGLVLTVDALASFFAVPAAVAPQENIGVTSTENFKTLTPIESPHEKGRVLACYDMTILRVWKELKEDEEFQERISSAHGLMNCSDMVEIKEVDLNADLVQEVIIRGKAPYLCSSSGNCAVWVFDQEGKKLLAASDHVDVVGLESPVQHSRTRGYSDLLLKERASDSETSYRTYVFDGYQYVESRCVYERPKYSRDGEGSWELITCEEFERRKDATRQ